MFVRRLSMARCLAALAASPLAQADFANGPDPYGVGHGFDRPDEATATWGGWSRGEPGTVHAEWDVFTATNPAAAEVGRVAAVRLLGAAVLDRTLLARVAHA